MLATLPATMMMAMASPMARPTPSTTAVATPLRAGGQDHPEVRLDGGGAQGQRCLLVLRGHGPQGSLGDVDDRGQDHDGQHDDGRQEAGTGAQSEGLLDGRDQYDHAHQAVDHGGYACQQLHRRAG